MKTTSDPDRRGRPQAIPEKLAISEEDIYAAMKEIPGYLDITPGDFRELYAHSYRRALERLTNSVRAADIMTQEVVAVELTTPLSEVAKRMAGKGISGLPVLDRSQRLAGMISKRDFLRHMGGEQASFMAVIAACLEGKGCAALGIRKGVAADIMTSPALFITPTTTLAEAAATLTNNAINRLPVLDEEGRLRGILTRTDLMRAHVLTPAPGEQEKPLGKEAS